MNIYEYAMQMEKDGEEFYRELADNCKVKGIKKILTMLANEEAKHFKMIAKLQEKAGNLLLTETTILDGVKNIFTSMKEEKGELFFDVSDLEAYRKAMVIEEESRKFYSDKASEASEEETRHILLRLASEEEKHFRIMKNIAEFVARPEPGNWLENAEWHHLDEY
ncbi:ferritin-like domain-containing protein [Candidatus Electrothrix sp.]|uniref:ferritin-like domain-containing protein n=1 Tax=Candidatus Electrothrix sp. TaxID=2170559 RepID=UPI0040563503